MEVKKIDCEYKEKCYHIMFYGMLANIGNRIISMPNCNECNIYKSEKKVRSNGNL